MRVLPIMLLVAIVGCSGQRQASKKPQSDHEERELQASLGRYRLLEAGKSDHTKGKDLILIALKATAYFKGDWFVAHGLLGCTLLESDVLDGIAYKSLFGSTLVRGSKLYATSVLDNALLADYEPGPGAHHVPILRPSLVFRRESVIYAAAENLEGRYTFDDEGTYARRYFPESQRRSNQGLVKTLDIGLKVYKDLSHNGYLDKTLRDSLGMVFASLDFDNPGRYSKRAIELRSPLQVYSDTLAATLARLRESPGHSYSFLKELGSEMSARGLAADDKILLPDLDEAPTKYETWLRLVRQDLEALPQWKKSEQNR